MDLFYDAWKLQTSLDCIKYASAYRALLLGTYGTQTPPYEHPYDDLDGGLWAHVDRVGFRVPTAEGSRVQRALSPHPVPKSYLFLS